MNEPESREPRKQKVRSAALEELAALIDSVIEETLLLCRLVRIDENGALFETRSLSGEKNAPFVAVMPRLSQPRTEKAADIAHSAVLQPLRPARLPKHLRGFMIPPFAGTSLADILEERGPLPLEACVSLSCKLLGAVEAIHAAGLVHGRIRPGAVFVDPAAEDLGASQIVLTDIWLDPNRPPKVAANYRAPEQLRAGGQAKPASDIWAVAVTLLELLHGQPLFEGRSDNEIIRQILLMDPQIPTDSPLLEDEDLQEVLLQALAKKDEHRFESAAQMAEALAELDIDSADDENPIEFGPARAFRNTRAEVKKILQESGEIPPYAPPGTPFALSSDEDAESLKSDDADALLDLLAEKDEVSKNTTPEAPEETTSLDSEELLLPDEEENLDEIPSPDVAESDFGDDEIENLLSGVGAIPPELNEAAVIDTDPKTTRLDAAVFAEAQAFQKSPNQSAVSEHDDSETLQVGSVAFDDMAKFMAPSAQSEANLPIIDDFLDGQEDASYSTTDARPEDAPVEPILESALAKPSSAIKSRKKLLWAAGGIAVLLSFVGLGYFVAREEPAEVSSGPEETSLERAAGIGLDPQPSPAPPVSTTDADTMTDSATDRETVGDGTDRGAGIDSESVLARQDSDEETKTAQPPPAVKKPKKRTTNVKRLKDKETVKKSKKAKASPKKRVKKNKKSKSLASNPFGG